MNPFSQWVARMLGLSHATTTIEPAERAVLDQEEGRLAGRLAVLTGKRRDDVLAEAYRRADLLLERRR